MDSWVTIQPRLKCIHFLYTETYNSITQPITFCCPSWLDPQPPWGSDFQQFSSLRYDTISVCTFQRLGRSGVILSPTLRFILNNLALTCTCTGYTNFKCSFLLDSDQSLEIWDNLLGDKLADDPWILFLLIFLHMKIMKSRSDVFKTFASVKH